MSIATTPESTEELDFCEVATNEVDLSDLSPEDALNRLATYAADLQASDLCLLSNDDNVEIRVRHLGVMRTIATLPRRQGHRIINFVKAVAGMDISQHRQPMDGRMIIEDEDHRIDLRVCCIPTLSGEDVTMRLWDHTLRLRSLTDLGMNDDQVSRFRAMLSCPSGLILVTGPTGVGKTTTLYAALEHLNDGTRKINTLEDPVEYALPGIRQTQIQPKSNVGFADLLRHVLRQAPDIIMIGEIRDEDTAITAVRAGNSGHLVLATLHSPYAADAIRSMLSLGSHPYFLSNCLLGVVAQRVVRTLCHRCRKPFQVEESPPIFDDVREYLSDADGKTLFAPGGCDACQHTGYDGRTGLFELMTIDPALRLAMTNMASSRDIHEAAIQGGMVEFRRGALMQVARGITSTEEILRVVPSELLTPSQGANE